jgi:hypothetical protein
VRQTLRFFIHPSTRRFIHKNAEKFPIKGEATGDSSAVHACRNAIRQIWTAQLWQLFGHHK